ncbi:MAG: hypothetical protein IPK23_01645 [Rhizobiales bacterium]|nr:hypothetical protein [Hyphomicrobiales bacterium]
MLRKATGIAGALAAGTLLTTAFVGAGSSPSTTSTASAPTQNTQINRSNKTDALPKVSNNDTPKRTTAVEVAVLGKPYDLKAALD